MIFIENVEQLIDYAINVYEICDKDNIVIVLKNEDIPEALGYLLGECGLDSEFIAFESDVSDYHGITINEQLSVSVDPIVRNSNHIVFGNGDTYFIMDEGTPSRFMLRQDIDDSEFEVFSFEDDRFEQSCPFHYDCVDCYLDECEEEMTSEETETLAHVIREIAKEEMAKALGIELRKEMRKGTGYYL